MKTGPNRLIVEPGGFLLKEGENRSLRKFRQLDFAKHKEAEDDIFRVHDWYQSLLASEQWAPDYRTVEKRTKNLLAAIEVFQKEAVKFNFAGQPSAARLEFNEALRELTRDSGLNLTDARELLDDARASLDRVATFLRIASSELSSQITADDLHRVSSKEIRKQYLLRLVDVFRRHRLDDGLGRNSLIVQVILRLDDRESSDAEVDEVRRKEVAEELSKAVKPPKGG